MQPIYMVVNAFLAQKSFHKMAEVFVEAAKDQGMNLVIKGNDSFINPDSLINPPSAALFLDKDLRLAKRMEMAGIRLYNTEKAIGVCDDKTLTSLVFEEFALPQPRTILSPMTFPNIGYTNLDFLKEVMAALPFPLVVKEGKGSFGQQVYLARDEEELKAIVRGIPEGNILFQEFIRESAGHDLRLFVVGDEVVASMQRVNESGDFRANIERGGTAKAYAPTTEEKNLALLAARACGVDFAGVDLLQSKDGPLICEVNSNAHFLGLMDLTGVNPAQHIISLIKEAL